LAEYRRRRKVEREASDLDGSKKRWEAAQKALEKIF
jgi:hypothetical protein